MSIDMYLSILINFVLFLMTKKIKRNMIEKNSLKRFLEEDSKRSLK